MTTAYLEEALNQLAKSGIKLGMKDIEHLSVLSPKIMRGRNQVLVIPLLSLIVQQKGKIKLIILKLLANGYMYQRLSVH